MVFEKDKVEEWLRYQELFTLLKNSDWKVIVNSELQQAGLPLKYPDLHKQRQAWRDEINELEEKYKIEEESL
jgi:hypothetical protein